MEITNIETIPGRRITAHYGLVCGSTVRSKNAFRDIGSSFKNMFGGELKQYTKLLNETRNEAINRLKEEATQLGANAIVNVRFATSDVAAGAAEIYVYGTAVKVE
ncbi:MAG: YbjQ family protein [Candidatus Omnitrophica bacterium]|nr:YbjQ family protein [Candidatus Omnitrophota bacterium]